MYCPNDSAMMHQTAVPTHYGQKVVIDQCEGCGGLWFDAFELYKTKQGADKFIEELDTGLLQVASDIDNATLLCPRDQAVLFQFHDPRFPKGILLMRCQVCQGFWLNRGEFFKYQQARQKLTLPKVKSLEDEKLDREVKQLLAAHRTGNNYDVLGRAGAFLSAPVGARTALPLDTSRELIDKERNLELFLNALIAILRIFIFK